MIKTAVVRVMVYNEKNAVLNNALTSIWAANVLSSQLNRPRYNETLDASETIVLRHNGLDARLIYTVTHNLLPQNVEYI